MKRKSTNNKIIETKIVFNSSSKKYYRDFIDTN